MYDQSNQIKVLDNLNTVKLYQIKLFSIAMEIQMQSNQILFLDNLYKSNQMRCIRKFGYYQIKSNKLNQKETLIKSNQIITK